MKILNISFKKDKENKTLLHDPENIEKLKQFVFPIIQNNEGWGSGNFTEESFLKDPESFQILIDNTVWDNVHIVMDNSNPVALLEFDKKVFPDPTEKSHKIMVDLLEKRNFDDFSNLLGKKFDATLIPKIYEFMRDKPIYTYIGVVLKTEIQSKKTGISEMLYKTLTDGIVFGYTSNPVIIRQRRKSFKNTLFFPSFGEFPNTVAEWAISLYTYADRRSESNPDHYEGLTLGVLTDPAFVEDRSEISLKVARDMQQLGKITKFDEDRIKYILSKRFCAGAIVSWN